MRLTRLNFPFLLLDSLGFISLVLANLLLPNLLGVITLSGLTYPFLGFNLLTLPHLLGVITFSLLICTSIILNTLPLSYLLGAITYICFDLSHIGLFKLTFPRVFLS